MAHHCHSDLDTNIDENSYADSDPYFEYQKRHIYSQVENKILSKFNRYEKIEKMPRLADHSDLFETEAEPNIDEKKGNIFRKTYEAEMYDKLGINENITSYSEQ
jgi:hypothetical protein